MQIAKQVAVVTGAASGMGEATARFLAAAGATIIVVDLDAAGVERVAAEIDGVACGCDVSDADSTETALATAFEAGGQPRILVNCAGVAVARRIVGRDGPMPLAEFQRVINVNLVGTFNVMRLCAAGMGDLAPLDASGERGVIVNTTSVAAFEGQIGQAAYSASKGGVVALTLQAAREFAAIGVRVMTIAPGL
ncbi:MAG: SDR family NAD(P)-dependent oxidoreductase, partial [Gammaproteobacteria bacterium]|nr:SDR family NAD(P)-dependent oxidoreductase [Gammaproteobacteria bacterium]